MTSGLHKGFEGLTKQHKQASSNSRQPIDQPFRLTLDFCLVWALLTVPTYFLVCRSDTSPWYSQLAALILLPLLATFVIYGPILLVRQILHSGARGSHVALVLLSILMLTVLLLGGLWASGYYTYERARLLIVVVTGLASSYMHCSKSR
jgi:hypothetical protein